MALWMKKDEEKEERKEERGRTHRCGLVLLTILRLLVSRLCGLSVGPCCVCV